MPFFALYRSNLSLCDAWIAVWNTDKTLHYAKVSISTQCFAFRSRLVTQTEIKPQTSLKLQHIWLQNCHYICSLSVIHSQMLFISGPTHRQHMVWAVFGLSALMLSAFMAVQLHKKSNKGQYHHSITILSILTHQRAHLNGTLGKLSCSSSIYWLNLTYWGEKASLFF